jgi:hypothetical protein
MLLKFIRKNLAIEILQPLLKTGYFNLNSQDGDDKPHNKNDHQIRVHITFLKYEHVYRPQAS